MVEFNPQIGNCNQNAGSVGERKPLTKQEAREIRIDFRVQKELDKAERRAEKYEARAERYEARGKADKAKEARENAQVANEQTVELENLIDRKRAEAELKAKLADTPESARFIVSDPKASTERYIGVALKVVDGKYYQVSNGVHREITPEQAGVHIAKGALIPPGTQLSEEKDAKVHEELMQNDRYYAAQYNRFERRFNDVVRYASVSQEYLDKHKTEDGRVQTNHMYTLLAENGVQLRDSREYKNLASHESMLDQYRQVVANWEDGPMPKDSKMQGLGGKYIDVAEKTTLPNGMKAFVGTDGLVYPMGIGCTLLKAL